MKRIIFLMVMVVLVFGFERNIWAEENIIDRIADKIEPIVPYLEIAVGAGMIYYGTQKCESNKGFGIMLDIVGGVAIIIGIVELNYSDTEIESSTPSIPASSYYAYLNDEATQKGLHSNFLRRWQQDEKDNLLDLTANNCE